MIMPLNAIIIHYYLLKLVLDLFDLAYPGFPEGVSPYPSTFLSVGEFLHFFLITKNTIQHKIFEGCKFADFAVFLQNTKIISTKMNGQLVT